ncbi:MAG: ABC transporter ATP-binding protein [Anaerovoracaceae bacterium]
MEKQPLIQLDSIQKYFKTDAGLLQAVNGVNLSIGKGETVGLVGESGCGKSTLGRCMARMYRPDGGNVLYKGKDIWSMNRSEKLQFDKEVQMVFQDPYASLDPLFVVNDIVSEGLDIHKMYQGKERRKRVIELLEMVGLGEEHLNRFPHEFSGGQRQRIGIARALAVEPELIVCDEPISALDVSIQAQVVNLLKSLQKEMGLSYLFITHDLSMVRQISDRIAVMYLGSIIELAPSEEIYDKNYHPYTKALLSAIPIADPKVEKERKRIIMRGDVPSPINLKNECDFCSRCPYATEKCRQKRPTLREISPGHYAACTLYE